MDYNSASSPLWDFSQSPSAFSSLAENDFLALLQKQFDPDLSAANPYSIPHDGVDPSKISNSTALAPPPPLSDDSSPSPPSTNDHLSSSRRQSTNSANELDSPELKRKASDDALNEDSPTQKTCMSSHVWHQTTTEVVLSQKGLFSSQIYWQPFSGQYCFSADHSHVH